MLGALREAGTPTRGARSTFVRHFFEHLVRALVQIIPKVFSSRKKVLGPQLKSKALYNDIFDAKEDSSPPPPKTCLVNMLTVLFALCYSFIVFLCCCRTCVVDMLGSLSGGAGPLVVLAAAPFSPGGWGVRPWGVGGWGCVGNVSCDAVPSRIKE